MSYPCDNVMNTPCSWKILVLSLGRNTSLLVPTGSMAPLGEEYFRGIWTDIDSTFRSGTAWGQNLWMVSWLDFWQLNTNKVYLRRGDLLRKCPLLIGLWANLYNIFFINYWCGKISPVGVVPFLAGGPEWCYEAGWASHRNKPAIKAPLWLLPQFLPLGSCSIWFHVLTVFSDGLLPGSIWWNTSISSCFLSWRFFFYSNRNPKEDCEERLEELNSLWQRTVLQSKSWS